MAEVGSEELEGSDGSEFKYLQVDTVCKINSRIFVIDESEPHIQVFSSNLFQINQ
jgi:hypothetical protein